MISGFFVVHQLKWPNTKYFSTVFQSKGRMYPRVSSFWYTEVSSCVRLHSLHYFIHQHAIHPPTTLNFIHSTVKSIIPHPPINPVLPRHPSLFDFRGLFVVFLLFFTIYLCVSSIF
ncbi:hypothetical protein O6H91_06G013200 [Diphasiastrum complanatum]|uniref:Uncharacterized protein n=1 Tax=Diphasiastrum complanatum TaxID=34168 RepID=A0ACC2DB69_DIPCM|nr:hypothetical protein O6H91_06G013200 [Diphasiastrum complanatum]